jgi:REP element-mobilizing transposase RayT
MRSSKFDPQKHHRRSIRLKGYDDSQQGAYYVTIVTYHRGCLFGEIVNEEMILNKFDKIADECWLAIPEHFPCVELGAYVIMPNHVHGIIVIRDGRARYIVPYHRTIWQTNNGFITNHTSHIQGSRHPSHWPRIKRHGHLAKQLLRTHHPG